MAAAAVPASPGPAVNAEPAATPDAPDPTALPAVAGPSKRKRNLMAAGYSAYELAEVESRAEA